MQLERIAVVGNYPPSRCGIATFTADLHSCLRRRLPRAECAIVRVSERLGTHPTSSEVRFEVERDVPASYEQAAEFLNLGDFSVVSLQHEFGLFGGASGANLFGLLRRLRVPLVTTLHTILSQPSAEQRRATLEISALSARMIVMSERGRTFLRDVYGVPPAKVDVIPHGIPDVAFAQPDAFKAAHGLEGKKVLLTFGLLSPNKGIEHVLRALPEIVASLPNTVYVVLGATHPNLVREHGEAYRESLEALAVDLGISENVRFLNQFVDIGQLKSFLQAADVYVTPYSNVAQITSGTLAYAFGCGKAIVSTPYWHAEELLADARGVLVPFADSGAFAREIRLLLSDDERRMAMSQRAYAAGRAMVWDRVAEAYARTFDLARRNRVDRLLNAVPKSTPDTGSRKLPHLELEHLRRMTDTTGLLQHACFTFPNYSEGYCLDDNARALLLSVLLEESSTDRELERLETVYASFVNHAFDAGSGRFHNFMGFDRRWLDSVGSDDSQGRALWALGTCVNRSLRAEPRTWAAGLMRRAMPAMTSIGSPRAWAFTLLGLREYSLRLPGDCGARELRDRLLARLLELYDRVSTPDWLWPEPLLAYENARLPQALIAGGESAGDRHMLEVGLNSLRWLVGVQSAPRRHFRPIGTNGFFVRGEERANFDQQPVEAQATVSACASAYQATRDPFWYFEARRAFDWFVGRNDLGISLFDPHTGACCDGLHLDRVNQNRGAESTLACLLALAEMQRLEAKVKHSLGRDAAAAAPEPRAQATHLST
jgi:glycosyltransferase involved in cell wall biosynthesis